MDSHSKSELRRLLKQESVPISIRQAIETVIRDQPLVFATADKLPFGDENNKLRLDNVANNYEPNHYRLITLLNAQQTVDDGAPPANIVESTTTTPISSPTPPAAKRPTLSPREIAVTATSLADLPAEVLSLIFDAYSRNLPSRFAAISLVSKDLWGLERTRLAKLPNPGADTTAQQFSASMVNAALVATLSVFLATAYPRQPLFTEHGLPTNVSRVSDEWFEADEMIWDYSLDMAHRRRSIALTVDYGKIDWDPRLKDSGNYEFVKLWYDGGVHDPGYISYNAIASHGVLHRDLTKTATVDMQGWGTDRLSYYRLSPAHRMQILRALILNGHPGTLPWHAGYQRSVYGQSHKRLLDTGRWIPKVLLTAQEFLVRQTPQPLLKTRPIYILKPEPTTWDSSRFRLANILELARMADETSQTRIVSAQRDEDDPAKFTNFAVRTNVFQVTTTLPELAAFATDPRNARKLPALPNRVGADPGQPYFLGLQANLTIPRNDPNVFSAWLGNETKIGEYLCHTLFQLLEALADDDLLADIKSCVSVYGIDKETIGVVGTRRSPAKDMRVFVLGSSFYPDEDDDQVNEDETNDERLNAYNAAKLSEYKQSASWGGNLCMEYRVVINRTKLYRLLQQHELGTVTSAFSKLWHAMTERLESV